MKKNLLLFIVLIAFSVNVWGQTEVDGVYYIYNYENGGLMVTASPDGYSGDIIIPQFVEYDGFFQPVFGIENGVFRNSAITSIRIEANIDEIEDYAFYQCESLSMVQIPGSVTRIGVYAFSFCYNLNTFYFDEYYSLLEEIGDYAFSNCALSHVRLPDGLKTIGNYAFSSSFLSSIDIPNTVISIGNGAFQGSFSGHYETPSVTIPSSVTSLGKNVFAECDALISINVDDDNPSYSSEDGVLFDKGKTELICCPIKKEGYYVIPATVTTVADSAFYNCNKLNSIILPQNLTNIGFRSFDLGHNIHFQSFTVLNPIPADIENKDAFSYIVIRVPASAEGAYKSAPVWKNFYQIIPGDWQVSAQSNNDLWGKVSGNLVLYEDNEEVVLEALPTDTYRFIGWTKENIIVSKEATYSFNITEDVDLLANFEFITCPQPFSFSVYGTTTDEAELRWTAGEAETQWNLIVTDTEIIDFDNLGYLNITSKTDTTVTNLIPGITYYAYLRAYCSDSDQSDWVFKEFRTKADCSENISSFPWFESFEDNSPSRDCWAIYRLDITNGMSWMLRGTPEEAYSGSKCYLQPRWSSWGGAINSWLVTPLISLPEGRFVLEFWSRNQHSGANVRSALMLSTGEIDPVHNEYVELKKLNLKYGEVREVYQKIVLSLDDYAGQDFRLAFWYAANGGDNWYLDDVKIKPFYPVTPQINAINVDVNAAVTVTFESDITAFDLSGIKIISTTYNEELSNVQAYIENNVLKVAHANFNYDTRYTVTIPAGSVKGQADDITWSFITKTDEVTESTNQKIENINIYPNPTVDKVFIESSNEDIPQLRLFTLQGILIQQIQSNEIDLSAYTQGSYILEVNGIMHRIVKK